MSKEKSENGNSSNKMNLDVVHSFFKQHSKETTANNMQISYLTNKSEELKLISNCKNSTLDELTRSLSAKTNELDKINEKYEKLQYNFKILHKNLLLQNKKSVELETMFDEARQSVNDQLQNMNNQLTTANTLLSTKEAECAAYLKDMQTQLEEANLKNSETEQRNSELQVKVLELENLLKTKKEEESLERQQIEKELQSNIENKRQKIVKKNKRIAALEKKVKALGDEKKALKNSLEMEGHKIRDLQRVLNRPINRASPVLEDNFIEHREIKKVEPIVPLNVSTSSSSRPASPVHDVTTQVKQETNISIPNRAQSLKRTFPQRNNNENQELDVFENLLQETLHYKPSTSAAHNRKNVQTANCLPSAASTYKLNRSSSSLNDDDNSSDYYPSYVPKKNGNASSTLTPKEAKRLRN